MEEKNTVKYKNQYYYIDNNSIKIQLVKKIEGSKESLKHIKITFEEENKVK